MLCRGGHGSRDVRQLHPFTYKRHLRNVSSMDVRQKSKATQKAHSLGGKVAHYLNSGDRANGTTSGNRTLSAEGTRRSQRITVYHRRTVAWLASDQSVENDEARLENHTMTLSIRQPWSPKSVLCLYLFVALALERCFSRASPLEVALTTEIDIDTGDTYPVPNAPSMPIPRLHEVAVDPRGQFAFDPPFIEAGVGERITFSFQGGNHTVTESTFMNPCSSRGAFDTNFFNSATKNSNNSKVTLLIDSDNPRWFHCRQYVGESHCERGMVFAINPGRFWQAFLTHASNSTLAKTSGSSHVSKYNLPTQWAYEPPSRTDLDPESLSTSTTESRTAEGPMTMTVATTTSTLHPNIQWSTQTLTTTFRARN